MTLLRSIGEPVDAAKRANETVSRALAEMDLVADMAEVDAALADDDESARSAAAEIALRHGDTVGARSLLGNRTDDAEPGGSVWSTGVRSVALDNMLHADTHDLRPLIRGADQPRTEHITDPSILMAMVEIACQRQQFDRAFGIVEQLRRLDTSAGWLELAEATVNTAVAPFRRTPLDRRSVLLWFAGLAVGLDFALIILIGLVPLVAAAYAGLGAATVLVLAPVVNRLLVRQQDANWDLIIAWCCTALDRLGFDMTTVLKLTRAMSQRHGPLAALAVWGPIRQASEPAVNRNRAARLAHSVIDDSTTDLAHRRSGLFWAHLATVLAALLPTGQMHLYLAVAGWSALTMIQAVRALSVERALFTFDPDFFFGPGARLLSWGSSALRAAVTAVGVLLTVAYDRDLGAQRIVMLGVGLLLQTILWIALSRAIDRPGDDQDQWRPYLPGARRRHHRSSVRAARTTTAPGTRIVDLKKTRRRLGPRRLLRRIRIAATYPFRIGSGGGPQKNEASVRLALPDRRDRQILLLRSFEDDRPHIERRTLTVNAIAKAAWGFGRVRVAPEPTRRFAGVGAELIDADNHDWPAVVEVEAERAGAVIVVVGRTTGLREEVDMLSTRDHIDKTIFLGVSGFASWRDLADFVGSSHPTMVRYFEELDDTAAVVGCHSPGPDELTVVVGHPISADQVGDAVDHLLSGVFAGRRARP